MATPKAVQQQARRADELLKENYGGTVAPGREEDVDPEETAAAAGESHGEDVPDGPDEGDTPSEDTDDAHPPQPTPEPDWEQSYRTLKGKYDAEVPQLQRDNRALQDRLVRLEGMLAQVNPPANNPEPHNAPAKQSPNMNKLIQEAASEYGDEFVDMIRAVAREALGNELRTRDTRLATLERSLGSVNKTMTATTQQQVVDHLAREVPNWEQVNNDPKFLEWLEQVDPYSGAQRKDLLARAFHKDFDANRVVAFFKGYLNETAAVEQAQPPARQTPAPSAGSAKQTRMETMVEPGAGRAGAAGNPTEQPVYTQAQIANFYDRVRRGEFRTRPEEKERIEADILAASAQGRIR